MSLTTLCPYHFSLSDEILEMPTEHESTSALPISISGI